MVTTCVALLLRAGVLEAAAIVSPTRATPEALLRGTPSEGSLAPAHAAHVAGRRPRSKETIARTTKTKKRIFAMPAALAAKPPNPNNAATRATTKNTADQYNMMFPRMFCRIAAFIGL